jgi:VanZ family protein
VPRYGAIAAAILIAVAYSAWNASPFPESNAVERFHFLQYGLITFLFYRAWRPLDDGSILLLPLLAGLIVGTAEEWFQWFIPGRVGEISDVFLNLVAIGSGLLFSFAVDPPDRLRLSVAQASRPRLARMASAALLALAAFFHAVHLGFEVRDPEVGTFTSRYSGSELLALQAERTKRWRDAPPPTALVRLSREDQYLSEGLEHVHERNELWTDGDIRGAWFENRILEQYFAPVLDTATHAGPGHRWPAEQRADAEDRGLHGSGGRPPDPAEAFVSDAYPYPVFAWSKRAYWMAVLVLFGVGGTLARATRRPTEPEPDPPGNLP